MSEEPIVSVESIDELNATRFIRWFASTVLVIAAIIIVASIYSNHYGWWGSTGQFSYYNERAAKVDYLKSLPHDELPEAYIVGSSAMLPFQPATVERIFGLRTFSLANFWGRAEGIWAWANFLVSDLKAAPKLIIIGLDTWTFSDSTSGPPLFQEYRHKLLVTPDLAKHLDDYSGWRFQLARVLDSFSEQNVRTLLAVSLKSRLSRKTQKPLGEGSGFEINGTFSIYNRRDTDPVYSESVYDLYDRITDVPWDRRGADNQRAVETIMDSGAIRLDQIHTYLPGDRLDPRDLDLFSRTIELLASRDVPVALIMLPVDPLMYDMLINQTRHLEHVDRIMGLLDDLRRRHANVRVVLDASHVRNFGGSMRAFLDMNHMTPDNTDRILEVLAKEWRD